jgi:uncharacterized protein YkwD
LHSPRAHSVPARDFEPSPLNGAPPHDPPRRHRRRALRPAIVASAALAAVAIGSAVGTYAVGRDPARPTAVDVAAGAPAESVGTAVGPAGQARIQAADQATATPAPTPPAATTPTAAPTTTPAAPKASPTGTAAAAGQATPVRPAGKPTAGKAQVVPPPPAGNGGVEAQVLTLVNQERAKAGCQPLTADSRLATAARLHSEDMAARNFFDHTNPDGVTFDQRITKAGYRSSGAAENIAKRQTTPASVMEAWMNSPGHRANILNCGLKNLGVGVAYQGRTPIWTQDFGSPLG